MVLNLACVGKFGHVESIKIGLLARLWKGVHSWGLWGRRLALYLRANRIQMVPKKRLDIVGHHRIFAQLMQLTINTYQDANLTI
jgi:hypothetical protein